jgi:mannose-6-phosphate isomerase-like protein (cupin superfamily)
MKTINEDTRTLYPCDLIELGGRDKTETVHHVVTTRIYVVVEGQVVVLYRTPQGVSSARLGPGDIFPAMPGVDYAFENPGRQNARLYRIIVPVRAMELNEKTLAADEVKVGKLEE